MAFVNSTTFALPARNKPVWLMLGLLLGQLTGFGQSTRKYLVLLRDKAGTPYSISQPGQFLSQRAVLRRQKQNIAVQERDLPVNPAYVKGIQQAGASVWYTSRWLNAVLIEGNDATLTAVQALPFVKGLEFGRSLANARIKADTASADRAGTAKFGRIDPLNYGNSQSQIAQIGADVMHQRGFHGEGMLIGVLDAGFYGANQVSTLKPLFDENRVLATYDFVKREVGVYEDDAHGTECLSALAATVDGQLYGTAFNAQYILLRTEEAATESRVEEANWLFGAEYADSAGVDVISSSLGYTEFDDASTSYTYGQLDGKTALSTRAAQIATQTGMVVVVAAGNDGNKPWRYLSVPADAPSVLAIGAVTQAGGRAVFSSIGPSADGRVKPDLVARGENTIISSPTGQILAEDGTSFATPLVAGLAAGFWQAHPELTAAQVTDALRRSGSQYNNPDAQLGYGIPNFDRAAAGTTGSTGSMVLALTEPIDAVRLSPNPFSDAEPLLMQWSDLPRSTSVSVTLTDLTGRILWRQQYAPGQSGAVIPAGLNLPVGLYFMTVITDRQKQTLKVIKR